MKNVMLLGLLIVLMGCSSVNHMLLGSPEQQAAREAQKQAALLNVKSFEADYDATWRATTRSLAENHFVIHSSDKESGVVSASLEEVIEPCSAKSAYVNLDLWKINADDSSIHSCKIIMTRDISILVGKLNDHSTEVKITHNNWDLTQEVNGTPRSRDLEWNEGISNGTIFEFIGDEIKKHHTN